MAYRGRGRGRGYGGGGGIGYAKQESFVLFPEGVEFPPKENVNVDKDLIRRSIFLQNYWKASPYYLEETLSKKGQSTEIETFSDRKKVNTTIMRDSLSQILDHKKFPLELTEGSKGWRQPSRKRVRWNPDSEFKKLEIFEKLERQAQNDKGEKEKKEGENEEEDEDLEDQDTEEEASEDDYNQNVDFDDDEDDFNMEDDGGDEDIY